MASESIEAPDNVVRPAFSVPAPPVDDSDIVISPDDVDYERDAPRPLTAAALNAVGDGPIVRTMDLYQTGLKIGHPVTAKVRIVNLTDRAQIGTLTSPLQNKINKLFFAPQPTNRGGRNRRDEDPDVQQKRVVEVARLYGVAGFVEPKLVDKREDVKDPEREAWVGNIELHDLQEYVRICEGDTNLAERRLERFPQ